MSILCVALAAPATGIPLLTHWIATADAGLAVPTVSPTTIPTTSPSPQTGAVEVFLLLLFTVIGVGVFLRARAYRPSSVIGPKRQPDRGGLWQLMVVALIGFMAWQMALGVYIGKRQVEWRKQGVTDVTTNLQALLTPRDYAVMSTIPAAIGAAAMIMAMRLIAPGGLTQIGFGTRSLRRGVIAGAIAFLAICPLVMWAMQAIELVYNLVHYHHATEHELLKKLGESHGRTAPILLILGATLVAPLLEELLFRGLLQTFLRHAFLRLSAPLRPPPFAVAPGLSPGVSPTEMIGPPPPSPTAAAADPTAPPSFFPTPEPPPLIPKAWHGWLAIVLTSLAFALLHDPWMRPGIFVLSLGLGYVYERTGSLWSSITVHLLFNSLNTFVYVTQMMGH